MKGRVLIVGGAGVFGRRLAEGLRSTTDVEIILAGRTLFRVRSAAHAVGASFAALDRAQSSAAEISALAPSVVVDASGPFQGADYRFARAVIEAGAHYVDLADARDFVAGFGALDDLAKVRGRAAITGASSTPALTHAALDTVCAGWRRVDSVVAGIAPGNRAPRGRSLVEAILKRAGAPTRVFDHGVWIDWPGWRHYSVIHVEGLGRRRFAIVETPDLDLVPARFATLDRAVFLAGLELSVLQRGIEAIGALRHWRVWRSPERWAAAFTLAARLVEPLGSDNGAMFVEALGRDASDRPCSALWTLLAPAGQGPYAPTLPALATIRKLLVEDVPPGARACVGLLSLTDFASDFERVGLKSGIGRELLRSPFERALGQGFEVAPRAVREAHRSGPVTRLVGEAAVAGAGTFLAEFVASSIGFPCAASAAPVRVVKRQLGDGREIWLRHIGGRTFKSVLSCPAPGIVRERFGPFEFDMKVTATETCLTMEVVGWRLGPLPLPKALAPRSLAKESATGDGRFQFDVPIDAPLLGRLTHYRGALRLETPAQDVKESAA